MGYQLMLQCIYTLYDVQIRAIIISLWWKNIWTTFLQLFRIYCAPIIFHIMFSITILLRPVSPFGLLIFAFYMYMTQYWIYIYNYDYCFVEQLCHYTMTSLFLLTFFGLKSILFYNCVSTAALFVILVSCKTFCMPSLSVNVWNWRWNKFPGANLHLGLSFLIQAVTVCFLYGEFNFFTFMVTVEK